MRTQKSGKKRPVNKLNAYVIRGAIIAGRRDGANYGTREGRWHETLFDEVHVDFFVCQPELTDRAYDAYAYHYKQARDNFMVDMTRAEIKSYKDGQRYWKMTPAEREVVNATRIRDGITERVTRLERQVETLGAVPVS